MSRDIFISDNLIKIRENLRQNPVKSPAADEPRINFGADNAKVELSENSNIRFAPELPQPAPRMQTRTPELDRERRELAGRIRRDYSCVAAEVESMEKKRKEAAVFLEFLARQQKELDAVDVDDDGASRELDRLAWEYYRMSGRWRAFSAGSAAQGMPESESVRKGCAGQRNSWLIPAAILLGSALVSIALLVSFL